MPTTPKNAAEAPLNSVLIVGASARALAQSAARTGRKVSTIDLFGDLDTQQFATAVQVDQLDNLGDLVGRISVDGWVYCGGMETRFPEVEQLEKQLPLLGTPASALRSIKSVAAIEAFAGQHGILFPVTNLDVSRNPIAETGSICWLGKKNDSTGGSGVGQPPNLEFEPDYWQQKIKGQSVSSVYVSSPSECMLVGLTQQLCGEPSLGSSPFGYCGSIGPMEMNRQQQDEFERIGNLASRHFGIVGIFGIDFVVNATGTWLIEINPRYPASAEILDRGRLSLFEHHVVACRGDRLQRSALIQNSNSHGCFGKAVLFNRRTDSITYAESQHRAIVNQGIDIADIPEFGTRIQPDHPILTVRTSGDTIADVKKKLFAEAAEIEDILARRSGAAHIASGTASS